jgi:hypothetical protein
MKIAFVLQSRNTFHLGEIRTHDLVFDRRFNIEKIHISQKENFLHLCPNFQQDICDGQVCWMFQLSTMLLSRYQSYKRLPSLQKGHVLLLQSSN